MAIVYKLLTQDEQDDAVARALIEREREHFHYELNQQNYAAILAGDDMKSLPKEWPAHLVGVKDVVGEKLAAQLSSEDYNLACALQYRDRVSLLLKTSMAEQMKCESVYKALDVKLPDGVARDAAVSRVKAAQEAARAVK